MCIPLGKESKEWQQQDSWLTAYDPSFGMAQIGGDVSEKNLVSVL